MIGGGSKTIQLLAKLAQLLSCDSPIFCLETPTMLSAQMLDDGEIRSAFAPIQTFAHFRQNEATGLATLFPKALVDGDHRGRGCRGGANQSRARKH